MIAEMLIIQITIYINSEESKQNYIVLTYNQ